jgi:hypothetical protein
MTRRATIGKNQPARLNQDDVLVDEEINAFSHSEPLYLEPTEEALIKHRHRPGKERAALCLSGGGIRSATFSLGVLQGLAKRGDLPKFDFLSTVSGGGFIGSWLSRWIHEEGKVRPNQTTRPIDRVADELAADYPETKAVKHLRAYSSYLAPTRGLSKDSLTLAAIISRNLVLTWLVLLPMLAAVLMIPRVYFIAGSSQPFGSTDSMQPGLHILILILFTLAALVQNVIKDYRIRISKKSFGLASVTAPILLIAAISLSLLPQISGCFYKLLKLLEIPPGLYQVLYATFCTPLLLLFAAATNGMVQGLGSKFFNENQRERSATRNATLLLYSGLWVALFSIALIVPLVFFYLLYLSPNWIAGLGGLAGIASIFIAYFNSDDGTGSTAKSNWLGFISKNLQSAGALIVLLAIAFILTTTNSFLDNGFEKLAQWVGHSQVRNHEDKAATTMVVKCENKQLSKEEIASGKIPCTSGLLILKKVESTHHEYLRNDSRMSFVAAWVFILFVVIASLLLSRYIGVNRFSLHALYGNRLVRAYLAAARLKDRKADKETDFDTEDNLRLAQLKNNSLLHIINSTINETTGPDLSKQQRKGTSFTFSAFHSGSDVTGFRESESYTGNGVSLGKAMTISGAAVSPSMGYHSSSLVSAVLTFLNARLGWWLPNPATENQKNLKLDEPEFGVWRLLAEFLGNTNSQSSFVHVSDGGHFDNLGLYEMVRRRCKTIVVVDAGQDENFEYKDLSNALRMIRIDFGIDIDFDPDYAPLVGVRPDQHHCRARIKYNDVDRLLVGKGQSNLDGVLIYIKPVLLKDKPIDLADYSNGSAKSASASFPHDSTMDQFFDESQFESYRKLGLISLMSIGGSIFGVNRPRKNAKVSEARIFEKIQIAEREEHENRNNEATSMASASSSLSKLFTDASNWVAPVVATTVTAATIYATVELIPPDGGIQLNPPPEGLNLAINEKVQLEIPKKKLKLALPDECELIQGTKNSYKCGTVQIANIDLPLSEEAKTKISNGVDLNLVDEDGLLENGLRVNVSFDAPTGCQKVEGSNDLECGDIKIGGVMQLDEKLTASLDTLSKAQTDLQLALSKLTTKDGLKINDDQFQALSNLNLALKTDDIVIDGGSIEKLRVLIQKLTNSATKLAGAPVTEPLENIMINTGNAANSLKEIEKSIPQGFDGLRNDATQGD